MWRQVPVTRMSHNHGEYIWFIYKGSLFAPNKRKGRARRNAGFILSKRLRGACRGYVSKECTGGTKRF